MKRKFKRADLEGNISPERLLKKQSTWNLASAMGITLEQAEDFLVYLITHVHNVAVANAESNPEVAEACRGFNKATFKLYHVPHEKLDVYVWIGMDRASPELARPDFLDAALERLKSGKINIAVNFGEILLAKNHGLN
jgi:hypothetical protein